MQVIQHAILPFEFAVEDTVAELSAFHDHWVPHFNSRYYQGSWTSLALRAPGGKTDSSIPDAIHDKAYAFTELVEHFPSVKQMLAALPVDMLSVRFLNLAAGAEILEHRDHELSFEHGEMRLHIPILTNGQVSFVLNQQRLTMLPGQCWYINANLPHAVKNEGTTDRVHLVVDCCVNDWLKQKIDVAEKVLVEAQSLEMQLQIIAELKRQQTPTALALARQLEEALSSRPS